MRELTKKENNWIKEKLKDYNLKFSEIYNEVYDHIISGIERRFVENDQRDIQSIFYDILYDELSGRKGIEKMQNSRITLVNTKLTKAVKNNAWQFFTTSRFATVLGIYLTFLLLYFIIHSYSVLYITSYLIAWAPTIYFLWVNRKNKLNLLNNKPSVISATMDQIAWSSVRITSLVIYAIPITLSLTVSMVSDESIIKFPQILNQTSSFIGVFGISIVYTILTIISLAIIETVKLDYKKIINQEAI